MAEIKLTVPDNRIQLIIDSITTKFGYQDTVNGQTNPETKAAFSKRMLVEWVKDIVKNYEWQKSQETIVLTTTDINIT